MTQAPQHTTQKHKVWSHLLTLGKISPLEAFGLYGIFRLASVVYDLRKDGYFIHTTIKRDLNNKPYAVYKLQGYSSIPQQESRLHRLWQMPITSYVVLEEGTFTEKLLKTLRDKTSELEKLKEKE
jgi:hypothetical protein